ICRSILAVLMLGLLLAYNSKLALRTHSHGKASSFWTWQEQIWILLGVIALLLGWMAAEITGHNQDARMRQLIMERTQLAAAAIPVDQMERLQWNDSDLNNPSYQRLKSLMRSLVRANKDLRFAMLMGVRDGKTYFLADSEAPESKDYSPPGEFYDDAEPSYLQEVQKKEPFVLGPIIDHWGSWITSSVPLECRLSKAGHVTMDLDVAATDWQSRINRARLPILLITLLIVALLAGSWLSQIKIREHAAQVAISERRNSALVEGSPNCVQMFDHEGLCLTINQNGIKALGHDMSEVIGRPFYSIWPPEARTTLMEAVQSTLHGHHNLFEAQYVRPDGRSIAWRVSMSPMKDEAGNVVSFVSIGVDITNRMLAEQALLKAKETAEAATRTKSEFLAVMSHEIRTPLSGVIGMLGLLQKQKLHPKQRRFAELARESAESLLEILNDLLDTAKIESGKLVLESIPFKPRQEFNRVLEIMRTRADAKELGLSCKIDDSIPDVIYGDPLRLRQVLANLISNAIKFTTQGEVRVALQGELVGDYFVHLRLEVSDTGIGISPSALDRIFNKFEQEDSSTTRQFGGTGLGLAIVKNIADIMGGDISVTSRQGEGSTFTFSALMALGSPDELKASLSEANASGALQSSASLSLLCAEDNATNRLVIQHMVLQLGHDVDFAENGLEAVEKLRANRYDAVLMDSRMPEMDGFQATIAIRAPGSGVTDPLVQIIALTANTSLNYREQCLAAGMNDYLEKPVREEALHTALEQVIAYQRQRGVNLKPVHEALSPGQPGIGANEQPAPASPPPGLSVEELLAMVGEDSPGSAKPKKQAVPSTSAEALQSIIRQYLLDAPTRLKEMNEALERRDGPLLARAAHSLKSMSLYVSAPELSERCARIEGLADEGLFEDTTHLIRTAELEFAKVKSRLQGQLLS
ncbi:MAG: ATP-binding protein, partial [Opitutaceae bacterium]